MKPDEGTRDHHDFSNGVRDRYRYLRGQPQMVRIRHPDGSVTEEMIHPATELDPDIRRYFPDSEAVNRALRGLIGLIPEK